MNSKLTLSIQVPHLQVLQDPPLPGVLVGHASCKQLHLHPWSGHRPNFAAALIVHVPALCSLHRTLLTLLHLRGVDVVRSRVIVVDQALNLWAQAPGECWKSLCWPAVWRVIADLPSPPAQELQQTSWVTVYKISLGQVKELHLQLHCRRARRDQPAQRHALTLLQAESCPLWQRRALHTHIMRGGARREGPMCPRQLNAVQSQTLGQPMLR